MESLLTEQKIILEEFFEEIDDYYRFTYKDLKKINDKYK